ncbi:hypothetical protein MOV66_19900 [Agrobacterium sp. SHOUNA12C]|uniref:hypothetical protein n=1 Tax=Rhizobium rhizogenes TaxID=359 RepID=UPI00103E9979|nr:hypothetical protein [Rhizobium rhizogenes]MCJ9722113.1 hypothetical protein [Agrobacterium sp. BETTINA12B]MCJ9758920.1 hypothetical protein [Agrobacterium sp. SHOUNA12C]MDJ1636741.1 hypothetical protein [Rhizobium rhizogenes]NTG62323.1 hypothetical protein [Rhizobium rhizogenes]NTG81785.1 hypothetical protein [Rhizobium rhizogenes]
MAKRGGSRGWRPHALMVLLICGTFMTSCSESEESPVIRKFTSSELHVLGNSCKGEYMAVLGGDFVLISDTGYKIVQKAVKVTDAGANRLKMTANFGSLNWITTFRLEGDDNIAVLEKVYLEPEPTAEQWALIPGGEAKMKGMFKQLEETPHLVLCPASTRNG